MLARKFTTPLSHTHAPVSDTLNKTVTCLLLRHNRRLLDAPVMIFTQLTDGCCRISYHEPFLRQSLRFGQAHGPGFDEGVAVGLRDSFANAFVPSAINLQRTNGNVAAVAKQYKNLIASLAIFCLQSLTMFAAEIPPTSVEWPAGAEALIDKAIGIKVEAQQQNARMYSEGGKYGHSFVKCLQDLAQILEKQPQIRDQLIEKEGADLKAKIALWSLDRKARYEEYARLEHLYISDNPIGKEVAERERSARRAAAAAKMPAPGGGPQRTDGSVRRPPRPKFSVPVVSDHDVVEDNRWILEYHYFAPPCDNRNENGDWSSRGTMIHAIAKIRNDKSLVMLDFDLEVQIESFHDEKLIGVGVQAKYILDFRSPRAFSIVASRIRHSGVRQRVREFINFLASIHPQDKQNPWYPKLEDFRKLANMEWQTDAEKELASWMKKIPSFPTPTDQ